MHNLLQYLNDRFETLQVFWTWSEHMHLMLVFSQDYYFQLFLAFELNLFLSLKSFVLVFEVHTLCVHRLEFSTDLFKVLNWLWTWSQDAHVILVFSSNYPPFLFLCPQLQRSWRGILLLVRSSVRALRFLMHSITSESCTQRF